MPGIPDHLLIIAFCVVVPIWGKLSDTEAGRAEFRESRIARLRTYWKVMALQWALATAAIAIWILNERPRRELGLEVAVHWRFWAGAAFVLLASVALFAQQHFALRAPGGSAAARTLLDRMAPFLPRTRREFAHFALLAITAGICEELLYRGFLFWYLSSYFGDSAAAWTAVVVAAALIFALAHLYQGAAGAIQVFVVGLVGGGLFLFTGSLLLPILLHAIMDLNGGLLAVKVYGEAGDRPVSSQPNESGEPEE